ncbi:YciI family protein [Williamsia sp. DF01-3]|uniref:YciI family protein n=1 Tax=Williamsia sp. DF01-3 TaxID=2934157 RepID=UPI001FF1F3CB|nr:YciI family protein [Williamsia sp. DF01-3]MCK0518518.1 YciI family protein [Williamsia sp. DF01-3]
MPLFSVEYTYPVQFADGRDTTRPDHRAWLSKLNSEGVVRMAGPYADGSGALILLDCADEQAAKDILAADPFAVAGYVGEVRINKWVSVFGPFSD